jgi:hypothetical protein
MNALDTPEYVLLSLTIIPNASQPGCKRVVTNVVLGIVYPLIYPEIVASEEPALLGVTRSIQYISEYTEPILIAIIA